MYRITSYYKRNEGFRYGFTPPMPVEIEVSMGEDETLEKVQGNGELMDLSLNGARIRTSLPIPMLKTVQVKLSFTMNDRLIEISGYIIWMNHVEHGLQFRITESEKKILLDELKMYAQKNKLIVREGKA